MNLAHYMRLLTASVFALSLSFSSANAAPAANPVDKAFASSMDAYLSSDENIAKIGEALERHFTKKRQEQQEAAIKAEQAKMEDQFKNPVKIDIGNAPVKGNATAKVTIIEFSDFQCPYCQRGASVIDQVMKAYPNDVKIAFKHYPLPFHDKAKPAAMASYAAQQQGKFWEMHDLLFKNQGELTEENFVKFATELKLNIDKFKVDMKSEEASKLVDADMELGSKNGVNGTPAFFINGVLLSGAQPLPAFKGVIDRFLKQ
jgi:protein-disulfide isomerase